MEEMIISLPVSPSYGYDKLEGYVPDGASVEAGALVCPGLQVIRATKVLFSDAGGKSTPWV